MKKHDKVVESRKKLKDLPILDGNCRQVRLAKLVLASGLPNRWGLRLEIGYKWDLDLLDTLLVDYEDKEVVGWLRYGWPINRDHASQDPVVSGINHKGAIEFPECVDDYLEKEIDLGATFGPFKDIPFESRFGVSPLNSRPKRDSIKRRFILDLSFPRGHGYNDGIPRDTYLGIFNWLT